MSRALLGAAAAACLALGAAGCGADEQTGRPPPPPAPPAGDGEPRATAPGATAPPPDADPPPAERERAPAAPESQPGGAGDEEAARSPADLTGRAGRITPRTVRVPPFLAVSVTLRSADGREYALRFGDRVLRSRRSATLELDGLRPGERAVGRPVGGAGTPVAIEASAEPGP